MGDAWQATPTPSIYVAIIDSQLSNVPLLGLGRRLGSTSYSLAHAIILVSKKCCVFFVWTIYIARNTFFIQIVNHMIQVYYDKELQLCDYA
jgi:hypothetical protein